MLVPYYVGRAVISFVICRAEKLKRQFKHLYVVVSVPTKEQNDSFNQSYFRWVQKLMIVEFCSLLDGYHKFGRS